MAMRNRAIDPGTRSRQEAAAFAMRAHLAVGFQGQPPAFDMGNTYRPESLRYSRFTWMSLRRDRCGSSHDAASERIMALRRIVDSRTELWKAKDPTAPHLPGDQHRRIAASLHALVWTEDQRGWWNASVAHQQRRWKQIKVGTAAAVVMVIAGAAFGWPTHQDRQNRMTCGSSEFSRQAWCLPSDPLLGFVETQRDRS